jgi:RNA polymerase sigma-70 factor (ECF subfamily)
MAEETELTTRARSGDLSALEHLFAQHGQGLHRLARGILGNADDAEDALQEVMVKVLRRPNRLDPTRPVRPYLWRITVNECLSRLRRCRRERTALAVLTSPTACRDQAASATIREVREAIGQLPHRQRVAITLIGFDGMDLRGAAEVMGCSVGTLKSHLHRAREKLKAALADHLPDEG